MLTPTHFASQQEMVTALSSGLIHRPEDLYGAAIWLSGQSVHDMIAAAQELQRGFALRPILDHLWRLGAAVEGRTRSILRAVAWAGDMSRTAYETEFRDELAMLSAAERSEVLAGFGAAVPQVAQMEATAGFRALTSAEQDQLRLLVGGDLSLSFGEAAAMASLLADPSKDTTQAGTFRTFLHGQPGMIAGPSHWATHADRFLDGGTHRYSAATAVSGHPFHSGAAAASRFDLTIEKTSSGSVVIPVYQPTSGCTVAGKEIPTLENLATGIQRLPMAVLQVVARIDLNPGANPDDAIWAADPGYAAVPGGFTGSYMTCGADRVVSIYPSSHDHAQSTDELGSALMHESGHGRSDTAWGADTTAASWAPWRAAMAADGITASAYARSSPAEDFAESWMNYQQVRGTPLAYQFRTMMPARFAILEALP